MMRKHIGLLIAGVLVALVSCHSQKGIQDRKAPREEDITIRVKTDSIITRERIKAFRRAVQEVPDQAQLYHHLSDEYALASNMDSALYFINIAIDLDSTNYYYWDHKKNVLGNIEGREDEMIIAARKCLEYGFQSAGDVYTLAQMYMKNQPDSTLAILERYEKRLSDPQQSDWMRVGAYIYMDSCDRAMEYAKQCEARTPNDKDMIHKMLGAAGLCHNEELTRHFLLKEAALGRIETQDALWMFEYLGKQRYYDDIIRILRMQFKSYLADGDGEKFVLIGLISGHQLSDTVLKKAPFKQLYDSILEYVPNDVITREGVLSFYEKVGEKKKIVHTIEKYIAQPILDLEWWQTMCRYELNNLLRDSGLRWNERTAALRSTSGLFPGYSETLLYYLYEIGETFGSEAQLDSIGHYLAQAEEGIAHIGKKDTTVARYGDKREIRIPLLEAKRKEISNLYSMRGDVLSMLDKDNPWEQAYEKALKWDRENYLAMNNYAYFLATRVPKKMRKAMRLSRKSLKGAPDNTSFLDTYGFIMYKLGRYEEAKKAFNHLLEIDNNPGAVPLQHYSDLLRAMGNELAADVYALKAQNAGKRVQAD